MIVSNSEPNEVEPPPKRMELVLDATMGPLVRLVTGARRGDRDAFGRLDLDDRVLLPLRYLWDLPVSETADALAIPAGTVKSRTSAALDRLRAAFDAESRR